MEPTLAVSIFVRSSIKFLHFIPFHQQIWPPRAILVSDWLLFKKIFSSETAGQNGAKLGRKHLCKILYKTSSFGSIRPTNMATKIISFFWLANVKKIFSSETAWPNGAKLGRKHLCKVQTWHRWSLGVSDSSTFHSRWLLFFKVMIISLWNLLQYHSIVRWAIQSQWPEPLVSVWPDRGLNYSDLKSKQWNIYILVFKNMTW